MTEEPTERRRIRVPNRVIGYAAVAAMCIGGTLFFVGNQQEADRADTATTVATDQATTVDRLCATDPNVARRIPDDCREARAIRDQVVLPAAAPGPSQAQVQGWVDDWVRRHPPKDGKNATPDMVARAVAQHMAGNGQQQIASVARAYIATNAERFRGPAGTSGTNGVDGQNATDDQVAAAVAAFCAEHGGCVGPQGEQGGKGDQGVGTTDIRPERGADGACEWIVTVQDPASGESRELHHPAGDAACPVAPPPTDAGGLLPGG